MLSTRHSVDCRKAFGRLDPTCPRCQELTAGAAPRSGWGSVRRQQDARRLEDIRAHDCKRRGCGPVCTAFDW
jgi:hypothetical protein